jgi:hypothetical protein
MGFDALERTDLILTKRFSRHRKRRFLVMVMIIGS